MPKRAQCPAVFDPQLSFGAGSGTENSIILGYEAQAGQLHLYPGSQSEW